MRLVSGHLLVATPRTGGFFARTVILVLHHDEDGAHGLTLNKPLEARVNAVLPDWQPHVTPPAVLYQGGPVGMDTAMGLVSVPAAQSDTDLVGLSLLFGGIGLVDLDAPPEVVVPGLTGMRVFVGYSGWGSGQLDAELVEGAWYVVDLEQRDPFTDQTATLWRDVLLRQRNTLSLVATHTDHPDRN